jgi:nucleoid-associated protein YgaU
MTQKFTLFKSDGTPVRAEVDVTFTQYKEALDFQNPTSGGGPIQRVRRVVSGDRLDRIAFEEYGDATLWRRIAQENEIANPAALRPGQMLRIPER